MEVQETKTIKGAIIEAIVKARKIILAVAVVLAIALVVLIVVQQITNNSRNENSLLVDTLDMAYADWQSEADEAKKVPLASNLEEKIAAALKGSASAQQYGYYIQGNLLYEKKSYADAAAAYIKSSEINTASYLYPVTVFLAAGAFEEAGDMNKCKENLKIIADSTGRTTPLTIRSIFSLARILEGEADAAEARKYYQKIIDTYPESNWTKLAHDRIIYLDVNAK